MSYGYPRSASAMYQQNAVHGRVEDADPHQLTMLLMDTAVERINQARNHLARESRPHFLIGRDNAHRKFVRGDLAEVGHG